MEDNRTAACLKAQCIFIALQRVQTLLLCHDLMNKTELGHVIGGVETCQCVRDSDSVALWLPCLVLPFSAFTFCERSFICTFPLVLPTK